jgi:RHS repeat-associated protein
VKTEIRGGRIETSFEYDALGRRVAKSEKHIEVSGRISPEQTRRFVWQGLRMVQELRETGLSNYVYSADSPYTPTARVDAYTGPMPVTYEPDSHGAMQPVQAKVRPRVLHFHTDLIGAPMEVTDEVGELAWVGDYTAWGKVKKDTEHAFQARIEQPLRYPGQYEDESTGLHFNTFRYYDPDVGRFISQDPIGLMGGENLYSYGPNPTAWVDPLGLTGERLPNTYHSFDSFQVPESLRYSSDAVQFNRANQSFINRMTTEPAFRRDMLGRNPQLGDWLKQPNMANSPPELTWHHHEDVGNLRLVDRLDHSTNHGTYHPTGKGGRDIWGGGKPGRTGKLNGGTGKPISGGC